MKESTLIWVALLCGALLAAGVALARPGMKGAGDGMHAWARGCDTNGDASLSREEFDACEGLFEALDANDDGVLDRQDHPGGPHPPPPFLSLADADRNREITSEEWQALVVSLDTDQDGFIAHEEVAARVHERMSEIMEMPPPPRPGPRERLDADDDGKISVAELTAHFGDLDRDGNGVVSGEELPGPGMRGRHGPGHPGMVGPSGHPGRNPADANADGQVTGEEWQALFASLDADGDGVLSADERPGRHEPGMRRPGRSRR